MELKKQESPDQQKLHQRPEKPTIPTQARYDLPRQIPLQNNFVNA